MEKALLDTRQPLFLYGREDGTMLDLRKAKIKQAPRYAKVLRHVVWPDAVDGVR